MRFLFFGLVAVFVASIIANDLGRDADLKLGTTMRLLIFGLVFFLVAPFVAFTIADCFLFLAYLLTSF